MARGAGFQGTYKVTPKTLANVVMSNWYYGFDRLGCGVRFAVFDDPSDGKKRIDFVGGGHIRVVCPHCNADRLYATDQVVGYQAARRS